MSFLKNFHPEQQIDNFSALDGTIIHFSFVKAAMKRTGARKVMDFGAGRGQFYDSDAPSEVSLFKQELMDLRSDGAEVWAVDVDPVVRSHPASHHQVVIEIGERLPFDDATFDVISSDVTFEHIDNPEHSAAELMRVLKPGGYLCARTPNKYGYVTFAARMVPNRKHFGALKSIAPARKAEDVFPTAFKMNTVTDIRKLFKGCEVYWHRNSANPSYYFNNSIAYRMFMVLHKILPNILSTSLSVFIRKPHDVR